MQKKITEEISISPEIREESIKIKNILDFKKEVENFLEKSISEISELILAGAINLNASDIHIEPLEKNAKIRLRIDGLLYDVLLFDKKIYTGLLSRTKLLSGIKLNITNRPQDGRFSVFLEEIPIEIRASTLPAEHGESIVLRILNPKSLIEIKELGLKKDLLKIIGREIKKPNGMVIVTGPTGCGKTTTLYAFLKKIQKPEIKIITIEDPIEYHLKGISQTQVKPRAGYDFASGLRSVMRHDPDVVLVGEIRDAETAKMAIQAALTGHLVLTTLHTNDAAGTVARLTSLEAKTSNIAPALNTAIAQRLIRKVCKKCAKFEKITEEDFQKIKKILKGVPKEVFELKKDIKIPKAKGCPDCNLTGYKGRIGIFEAFLVDSEMEKFILKNPSIAALRDFARKKGMITLKQDGIIKVLEGITTIEEVERITGE